VAGLAALHRQAQLEPRGAPDGRRQHSQLCDDYIGSIDAMIADIDQAADYVHVEFFILVYDDTTAPFFDALARACRRGVTVRMLSDHVAQYSYPNRKKTLEVLHAMGAQYQPMLPLQPLKGHWRRPDLRNHRKLVVIDGRVAHTGSSNMDIRSLSLHMELMVVVQGTDFVDSLRAVEDDYRVESRQVTLDEWLKRPRTEKAFDNLIRMTSSLM
jgi:phosphatidylserine/phosphatidylglycerophosphate/cardiolipin synthase-like enzyme